MTWFYLFWITGGLVSYGLSKGDWKIFYEDLLQKNKGRLYYSYKRKDEFGCWVMALGGPVGSLFYIFNQKKCFCLKMPAHLKNQ